MPNKVHRQSLEIALDALAAGNTETSRRCALGTLYSAAALADHGRKADAFLLLSRLELLDSRAGASLQYSSLALESAEALHDPVRAGEALELQSCAANYLGQTDLAEACARQCLELHASDGDARALAIAHNYLAAAATWQFQYDAADVLFGRSVELSRDSSAPGQRFHPLVNQVYSQIIALRISLGGPQASTSSPELVARMSGMVKECQRLFLAGHTGVLYRGMQDLLVFMMVFVSCEVALLEGDTSSAYEYLSACRARASNLSPRHWTRALLTWVEMDFAEAVGNERVALALRRSIERQARLGGHEPLRQVALLMDRAKALPE